MSRSLHEMFASKHRRVECESSQLFSAIIDITRMQSRPGLSLLTCRRLSKNSLILLIISEELESQLDPTRLIVVLTTEEMFVIPHFLPRRYGVRSKVRARGAEISSRGSLFPS
ncbi:unnamed protein product [Cuscuta epithymum]|uniref:Uncharacterized protein n=1 Tax=Cuscuta epithymum TaxID=186058 RepID=A0AAV0EV72_9ASTE|nr:unnamed protein product [Cuscuta epithymum]